MADPQMVLEVLRAARALIDTPEKWCGDGWGEDGTRCAVHAINDAIDDAIGAPRGEDDRAINHPAYLALYRVTEGSVGWFNDSHSHDEVLAKFDEAIDRVRYGTFIAKLEARTAVPA